MTKAILAILVLVLGMSQYKLWFGQGSIAERQRLEDELAKQASENRRLAARNSELVTEIQALKTDPEAIEELLRSRFGYVREGEIFIRLISNQGQRSD